MKSEVVVMSEDELRGAVTAWIADDPDAEDRAELQGLHEQAFGDAVDAAALEELQIINQPLASIAKKEEILFVYGREGEPVALDHHSPALHLIQQIRDEAHRFAVTFHRARRSSRELTTDLLKIPGVGAKTAKKLLTHYGSVAALKSLSAEELSQVVGAAQAIRIHEYLSNA